MKNEELLSLSLFFLLITFFFSFFLRTFEAHYAKNYGQKT